MIVPMFANAAFAAAAPAQSAEMTPDTGIAPELMNTAAIDPQSWRLSRDMTAADWTPNPVIDWVHDETVKESRMLRGALILIDFPDREFVVTKPKGSDLMKNPVINPVTGDEQLRKFWHDYLMVPGTENNGLTLDSYWRENTYGVQDITLDTYGPYTLSRFEFMYQSLGITADQRFNGIFPRGLNMAQEAYNLAKKNGVVFFVEDDPAFDFMFFVHAGYDPSGLWQEVGEMMFLTTDDIKKEYSGQQRLEEIKAVVEAPGFNMKTAWPNFYLNTKPSKTITGSGMNQNPMTGNTLTTENNNQYTSYRKVKFDEAFAAAKLTNPALTEAEFETTFRAGFDAILANPDDSLYEAIAPDILKGHLARAMEAAEDPIVGGVTTGSFAMTADNKWMKWSATRYVPWTSWFASMNFWTTEGTVTDVEKRYVWDCSTQGESDGMGTFAHEFGHIRSLPDNYNSPYSLPMVRSYTGPWDLMSRGSGNGPGGFHQRYQIPSVNGGASPPNQLIYGKIRNGFAADEGNEDDVVNVVVADLIKNGPVVEEIVPRNIPTNNAKIDYGVDGYRGLVLTGFVDQTPRDNNTLDPNNAATGNFIGNETALRGQIDPGKWNWGTYKNSGTPLVHEMYTIEVVDQIGYDSFCFDHGVLLAKNVAGIAKEQNYHANSFVVDAHPGALGVIDFTRPNGARAEMTDGDQHQLAAALFHAGIDHNPEYGNTFVGNKAHGTIFDDHAYATLATPEVTKVAGNTVNEWVDEYNGLHFYIIEKHYNDSKGVKVTAEATVGKYASYTVGVLHEDGPAADGMLELEIGSFTGAEKGNFAEQVFTLKNTGETDIVRVTLEGTLAGDYLENKLNGNKSAVLLNNLFALKAGEEISFSVFVKAIDADLVEFPYSDLVVKAASETNPDKTASSVTELKLATNGHLVEKGQYFTLYPYFTHDVVSNTAVLEFSVNKALFTIHNFTPESGVTVLTREETDEGIRFIVMVDDYNTQKYGGLLLQAKEDADLKNEDHEISVSAKYVVKLADDTKEIHTATASTIFNSTHGKDPFTEPPGEYTLITLSNIIDRFGAKKGDADWDSIIRFFDYNNNGRIDIHDIVTVAQKIKL